jgi:hypothetical protein
MSQQKKNIHSTQLADGIVDDYDFDSLASSSSSSSLQIPSGSPRASPPIYKPCHPLPSCWVPPRHPPKFRHLNDDDDDDVVGEWHILCVLRDAPLLKATLTSSTLFLSMRSNLVTVVDVVAVAVVVAVGSWHLGGEVESITAMC